MADKYTKKPSSAEAGSPPADAWKILYENMPEKFDLIRAANWQVREITLQANKGVYGLGDAPRLWRERFHEWMMKRGFTQSRYDECFYFMKLFKGSRVNKLLVTMHVDDCEVAGCPSDLAWFKKALVAEFGEVKQQQWDLRHCGIEYHQSADLKEMTHSQKHY